jgi:TolB-like protein
MGRFFAELRRRNVFRVAGVYLVVGWVIIQVVANVATMLGLPAWFGKAVIVLLAAGFPLAVIFAWAFEMTPEGVKLTANIPESQSIASKTGRKLDYVILGGLALAIVLIVGDRLMPEKAVAPDAAATPAPAVAAPAASIAVLPFADLSPDADQQYFSDGIAEEILNVLARIEGLKVASRTSSFAYKSQSAMGIPAIARELGVRHVLEGSVRKAGDTIRVTAQLIDAETDAHLWSETFDRPLTTETVFAIQDEIAAEAVGALRQRLGVDVGEAAPAAVPTDNVGAYELYLKGRALFQARRELNAADHFLEDAIAIDPQFADALAIRAALHQFGGEYGGDFGEATAARTKGRALAEEALAINDRNSLALGVKALSHLYDHMEGHGSEDYEAIFSAFDKSLALDPNNSNTLNWQGIAYGFVGDNAKAAEIHARCVSVDPALAACRSNLAMELLSMGRGDEAATVLDEAVALGALSLSPGVPILLADLKRREAFLFLSINVPALHGWRKFDALYEALSNPGGDRRAIAAELRTFLDEKRAPARVYGLLNAVGDYDRPLLLTFHWLPAMRAYRRSPEFKAHMTASGLPEYWRKHGFPPQCKPVGKDDFDCE